MPVSFTLSQVIQQLRTSWGGFAENNTYPFVGNPISYAILTAAPLDSSPENTGWQAMSTLMANRAAEAFELWDDLIAVSLNRYSSNPPANANLIQFGYSSTTSGGGTYEYGVSSVYAGTNVYGGSQVNITRAEIWLNSGWSTHSVSSAINQAGYGYYGGYGLLTYQHEIGHALGLSHPGSYNGSGSYATDAEYLQDTRRYTIMSYFNAFEDGSGTDHWGSDGFLRYAQTPMVHDVAAIQAIYSADTTTRTGNTTYGFNSTAGLDVFDFTRNTNPIVTIYDAAGTDTLDLSGFGGVQRIDLTPGAYSDVGGYMTNNLGIAYSTTIENAIGGSGNDAITGNSAGNTLTGNAGNDTLQGLGANDTLYGGTGNDLLYGGDGDDWLDGGSGQDRLDGGSGFDAVDFRANTAAGTINLTTGTASFAGFGYVETLVGIEKVLTGSGNDLLIGDAGANELWGGGGDDRFQAGAGTDFVYGEAGTDYAVLTGSSQSYTIVSLSLGSGQVVLGGLEGTDTFLGVEYFQFLDRTVWWQDLGLAPPEITVLGNGANIVDGDTTPSSADNTDFGSVTQGGAAVQRTYSVRNDGSAALVLGTPSLPGGFALVEGLSASIAAGQSDTFTVRLDTATAGTKQGQISFTTNDGDESPFNFSITGTVVPPLPTVSINGGLTAIEGSPLAFTFSRAGAGTASALVVNFTVSGQATSGVDFTAPASITIAAGQTSAQLGIATIRDFVDEPINDESVVVTLASNPSAYTVGTASATGYIRDADQPSPPLPGSFRTPFDFGADGKSDILWQSTGGQAAVWQMDGASVVSAGDAGANPGAAWRGASAGDFNGDRKADILWQNAGGQAAVWLMDGTSVLSSVAVGPNPGSTWHVKDSGDFNGDGKADILWQHDNGQAVFWLMDGGNVVSRLAAAVNPGPSWHVMGTGDFNRDSKSDILWQHDNGQAALWLMNGAGLIGGGVVGGNPGAAWHVKDAGDFNGDGKADILWQHDNGQAAVWLMNGTGLLAGALAGTTPGAAWHVIGARDFNGDGKADILWQHDNGQARIWLMEGTGILADSLAGANPGSTWKAIG
jgi:serralysin